MTLQELNALDRAGLAALWAELLGGAVPPSMSQLMQRRFLAYALQVRQDGDLAPALAARLERLAAGEGPKVAPGLKPGARLLRAWNGTTHVVDVVSEGFVWNGTVHRSLSAIARAITGARWSGPRFFGLTDDKENEASASSAAVTGRGRSSSRSPGPSRKGHAT
jgi:hypothetical protein